MTKDRARKRAARERANLTGERYVTARRNLERQEPAAVTRQSSPLARMLDDWTHRVPGVPAHRDSAHRESAHQDSAHQLADQQVRNVRSPHRSRPRRPSPRREPRVLVGWQNWIGRQVAGRRTSDD